MESKNPNNMKNQGNTRFLSYSIIIWICAWNKITGIWQCYNKAHRSFIKTQQKRSKYLYVNALRLQNICDAHTILKKWTYGMLQPMKAFDWTKYYQNESNSSSQFGTCSKAVNSSKNPPQTKWSELLHAVCSVCYQKYRINRALKNNIPDTERKTASGEHKTNKNTWRNRWHFEKKNTKM